MELIILDRLRDLKKCLRGRFHRTRNDHTWHDVVLISNRAECKNVCLRGCLKHSQTGCISIVDDDIRALTYLRQSRLLCSSHVIEFAGITDQQAPLWPHREEAAPETLKGQTDRREFNTAYRPRDSSLRDAARQHAFGESRLIHFEGQRRNIARRLATRADHKIDTRKVSCDTNRRIGVFVTVSEDQIEFSRSEIAKSIIKIGGRSRLHHRRFGAELGLNKL